MSYSNSLTLKFMTFTISASLAACSSGPTRVNPSEVQNSGSFLKDYDFAFTYKSDQYYFNKVSVKTNDDECIFVIGFKNGTQVYSFPEKKIADLSTIYYGKHSLEQKKALTLKELSSFKMITPECQTKDAKAKPRPGSAIESAGYVILFAPLIVPFVLVELTLEGVEKARGGTEEDRVSRVRLGMTVNQVMAQLGAEIMPESTAKYSYYYHDYQIQRFTRKYRLAMAFEDGRLSGMVRGPFTNLQHAE